MNFFPSALFRSEHQHTVLNSTTIHPQPMVNGTNNGVFWLFRISFMLYPVIGFAVSMVIGQAMSWLTGGHQQQIDEHLLLPFFQSAEFKERQRRRQRQQENSTRYTTIDQMLVEMMKKEKEEHKTTTTATINGNDHDDDDADDDEAIATVADAKSTTN